MRKLHPQSANTTLPTFTDGDDAFTGNSQIKGVLRLGSGDDRLFLRGGFVGVANLGDGNDLLHISGAAKAVVRGGGGDDIFHTRTATGRNIIEGGSGSDTYTLGPERAPKIIETAEDTASIDTVEYYGIALILPENVEAAILTGGSDRFHQSCRGNALDNTIYLYGHNATARASSGNDTIFARSMVARVEGGVGNDTIIIECNGGSFMGGKGADVFDFSDGVGQYNVLGDFETGVDKIDLADNSAFDVTTANNITIVTLSTGEHFSLFGEVPLTASDFI